tara:strand:+ start:62 stop:295 length:234 start_codon:yes stop_codon:yes gene_type:complete
MLDDIDSEDLKLRVLDLMYVLYEHGIDEVHMGGLMRILGVDNEIAVDYDEKILALNADFAKYMSDIRSLRDTSQTLH